MQSSIISKIEKARRYASERNRMRIDSLHLTFHGDNGDHEVSLDDNAWGCTCSFFAAWQVCSHTMAVERILEGMVPEQPVAESGLATA